MPKITLNIKTFQREDYRTFYLKKPIWQAICLSRGWPVMRSSAKLAASINITRQYASAMVRQDVGCSTNVMAKIVDFLGIRRGECWCHLFDMVREPSIKSNHPLYNKAKYKGEVPYEATSPSHELRSIDYGAEKRGK